MPNYQATITYTHQPKENTMTQLPLVEFQCGCIGFLPDSDGKSLLVKACDHDCAPEITLFTRDMSGKSHTPHSNGDITDKLSRLVADGHRWQRLKRDLCEN